MTRRGFSGFRTRSAFAIVAARRARALLPAPIVAVAGSAGTLAGIEFTQVTQANAVFATLPTDAANRIREKFRFYDWDAARREVRWMCSFDTTAADVDAFVAALK